MTAPEAWPVATVGDIATLADGPFGSNLKTAHYTASGPRVIRLQNIGDGMFIDERAHIAPDHYARLEKHAVAPGDVVAASLGENAPRACLVPPSLGPAIVKADCIRIRAAAGIEPAFLMWVLNSPQVRDQASRSIKGIGRPRLGLGGIRRLSLPIPPSAEQRRIVAAIEVHLSRLDAADDSLGRARRRMVVLVSAVLAAATAHSDVVELGSLAIDLRYGTSLKCGYEQRGVAVLRIPNIQEGRIDPTDLKFASDPSVDLSPFLLDEGDLLFVRTNGSRDLIGRTAVVDGAQGMAFASYLIRARLDRSRVNPQFGAFALSTPASRALIEAKAATTAGQYNLNLAALRSLPIPLPPVEEQRRIVAEVERQLSIVDAMSAQVDAALRRSKALRRAILEQAFTGNLVRQDPADEPASVLLERIAAERAAARRDPSSRRAKAAR